MQYAVTIERPSFATVVIEAEDELEAERLAKGRRCTMFPSKNSTRVTTAM